MASLGLVSLTADGRPLPPLARPPLVLVLILSSSSTSLSTRTRRPSLLPGSEPSGSGMSLPCSRKNVFGSWWAALTRFCDYRVLPTRRPLIHLLLISFTIFQWDPRAKDLIIDQISYRFVILGLINAVSLAFLRSLRALSEVPPLPPPPSARRTSTLKSAVGTSSVSFSHWVFRQLSLRSTISSGRARSPPTRRRAKRWRSRVSSGSPSRST